jgi:hypothetical protein
LKETTIDEEVLARYLLGQMSDEERDQLDERYFGDRDFIEQLLVVEDELIDSYVRGELSPSDRRDFENHFLRSPERQQRVALANKWLRLVSSRKGVAPIAEPSLRRKLRSIPSWVVLPLAASLLFAATSLWLGLQITRLNAELNDVRHALSAGEQKEQELERLLADERQETSRLQEELARARAGETESVEPDVPRLVALVLSPGRSRSEGSETRLVLPPDTNVIRLQANFKVGSYSTYSATLETAEGVKVFEQRGLKARQTSAGRTVSLSISASRFAGQDYVLIVSGITATGQAESVGEYSFRVVRK